MRQAGSKIMKWRYDLLQMFLIPARTQSPNGLKLDRRNSLIHTKVRFKVANGRLVMQEAITSLPHLLNVEKLSPGIYYVQLENGTTLKLLH